MNILFDTSYDLNKLFPNCRVTDIIQNYDDKWHLQPTQTQYLTHWGRVTHMSVNKITTIGSDNGMSPVRRQAIIWTNVGIFRIGP